MLHGWTDMSGRMPLYKEVDQWCLPWYQSLICVSKDLVEECKRLRIPDSKIHLVHNGIDVDQFQRSLSTEQAKKEIGARDGRFLIGSVGRLSPEKGFVELIRAFHSLQHESIPIDLWIAGDGPQRTELEKLIVDLGLQDSVKLLGQLKDTKTFYQAMDLFVLNSIREGLPNVLLEAMALGTPVVATAIAGIPSLVLDGICGRLIAPQNDAELRSAIRDAIHGDDKTTQMAIAARLRIEQEFSFAVRMEKIARIYEDVIHGRKVKREL
jgi:glycosyltransferase involved in cell wall biosynthesis